MGVVAVSFFGAMAAPFPFACWLYYLLMAKSNPSKNFLNSGSTVFGSFTKSWYKFSINAGDALVI